MPVFYCFQVWTMKSWRTRSLSTKTWFSWYQAFSVVLLSQCVSLHTTATALTTPSLSPSCVKRTQTYKATSSVWTVWRRSRNSKVKRHSQRCQHTRDFPKVMPTVCRRNQRQRNHPLNWRKCTSGVLEKRHLSAIQQQTIVWPCSRLWENSLRGSLSGQTTNRNFSDMSTQCTNVYIDTRRYNPLTLVNL